MKIRSQFYILLSGIIIIPLIAFGALMLVNYYRSPERLLVPGYKEIELLSDITKEEKVRISAFISRLPHSVEALLLNREMRVVYSGFEEIALGTLITPEQISRIFASGGRRYLFQVDYNFGRGFGDRRMTENLMLITRMRRDFRPPPNRYRDLSRAVVLVFIALFVFCALVLTMIARSVARSVTSLEEATRHIAEGNLDTAIAVKGGNEIASLAHSLNTMRLSLKVAQTRRSRFIMGVSHDLRTPLALIKGYTEAVADGVADSPEMRKKSLEIVGDKIDQLEEMIDDLINFVKLDTGEWRTNLEKKALKPILDTTARRLAGDGNLLGRTVETRVDLPEDLEVPLDERFFLRALENLSGNALRYTAEGGTVRLEAWYSPASGGKAGAVSIRVSDNGCGIAAEDLPYIFDPFYRGSNSRREDGKGLGLSVVKSVVDSHGWDITVKSEKGQGSAFTIRMGAE
ncbi:MAG: HAMP domain-containing histidine kinase [Treponema sp.]|jgi:signal transduction histidine kinase|nr:HAMP domain-containing histidine kinase [Treponema sp.]